MKTMTRKKFQERVSIIFYDSKRNTFGNWTVIIRQFAGENITDVFSEDKLFTLAWFPS